MVERIFVYGRKSCPFCRDAAALLEATNLEYDFIDLEDDRKMLTEVKAIAHWPTVPVIFARSGSQGLRVIGGFTELEKYLERRD